MNSYVLNPIFPDLNNPISHKPKLIAMKKFILICLVAFAVLNVNAQNTAYGTNALISNTTGTSNSAFGISALRLNTTGSLNTAIGESALYSNISGGSNVAVGVGALGNNTTGDQNIAVGTAALSSNTTGSLNFAIGYGALLHNTTGFYNLALGGNSMYVTTTGSYNTSIGEGSGGITTGNRNTSIGWSAGASLTTGDYNTIVGTDWGGGNGIVSGSNNTIIGARITGLSSSLSGTIILADGAGKQRLYIDNNGNAGFGTTTPNRVLEVDGGTTSFIPSGLRLTQLNSSATVGAANGKVLSVNSTGDVILTAAGGGGGSSYWDAVPLTNHIINNNAGAVVIGDNDMTYVGDYKLYVSDGIITEKVKVAVKNSTQWADYVFDEKYNLLDIAKLDKFITKNKHLPGIQSSTEVKENGGFELGQMTVKLLEKVEELTLYVIQLKKENDAMKSKLDELKNK